MFFIFLAFWLVLNGRITLELLIIGSVISAALYAFICKFMGYSPRNDLLLVKNLGFICRYAFTLFAEIFKANLSVLHFVYSPHGRIDPVLVRFKTPLKSDIAKVCLANSITITPGTITVTLEGDEFCVHCFDASMAEGIENNVFCRLLSEHEAESRN